MFCIAARPEIFYNIVISIVTLIYCPTTAAASIAATNTTTITVASATTTISCFIVLRISLAPQLNVSVTNLTSESIKMKLLFLVNLLNFLSFLFIFY